MKKAYLILCENAFLDQQKNTCTLISMLSTISTAQFPIIFPCYVYVFVRGWVGDHEISITITGMGLQEQPIMNLLFQCADERKGTEAIQNVEMRLDQATTYTFRLYIGNELMDEAYLNVHQL